MSSVSWWLNPVRLYSLYKILYEVDIILLYIGYHSIPKQNTTQTRFRVEGVEVPDALQ